MRCLIVLASMRRVFTCSLERDTVVGSVRVFLERLRQGFVIDP